MPTLVDKLNSLCKHLDDSYDINRGGCCFVSSIIARYLDKLGIKYNLIIFDREERNEEGVIYNVQNNCNQYKDDSVVGWDYTCSHYCLEIISSDKTIGNGLINCNKNYYIESHNFNIFTIPRVTYENLDWIYDKGDWNNSYEAQRYNNIINNTIHELFTEYENYTKKQSILSKMFAIDEPSLTWGLK